MHEMARVLTPDAGFEAVVDFDAQIEVVDSVATRNVNAARSMAVLDRCGRRARHG